MPSILQNHYVLAVHDLGASSEFFQKLGFAVVLEPEGWVFVKRDNCMVMLGDCRDSLPASSLGDHSYFGYLRVDDADAYYKEIKSKGVTILSPLQDKPWEMREFAVRSPEGHRITIGQFIGKEK
ncbi:MAG TPA: VOC family protein [Bacteroidota bacterium]|jgi:catechol 2,3-dioxygenase-like lactoylglutathione lyase family enzyme